MKNSLRSKTVIAITESRLLSNLIEKELLPTGATIRTYTNGLEGLAAIRHTAPDLVFLDLDAPLMSGEEIVQVLESEQRMSRHAVIIVAESSEQSRVDELLGHGVAGSLMKDSLDAGEILDITLLQLGNGPEPAEDGDDSDLTVTSAPTPAAATKPPRVCVVEDDPLLRNLLSAKFARSNIRASFKSDGSNAITFISEFRPDVVILDLMLPGRSGFDVLKDIRENPETAQLPVIVLSNRSNEEDFNQATELGVKHFFVKALTDLNDVVDAITKLATPQDT